MWKTKKIWPQSFLCGIALAAKGSSIPWIAIGISLGTTSSRAGVYVNGHVEIIPNEHGSRTTPSWVAFTDNELLVGDAAKNQALINPERTIFDIQRLMGRKFNDLEVQRDIMLLPYKVVTVDGKTYIQVKVRGETKVFSPEQITAMIITKMKETAKAFLETKNIKSVVITVPAYFNDAQRQATKDADRIAGINVDGIINEPNAAVHAYGLEKNKEEKNILVYDLGGGTFDVSILTTEDEVIEVKSTGDDTHLGGEDFNHRLMEYFIKLIKTKYNKDISRNHKALWKLRRKCERAHRAFSFSNQFLVEIESLFDGIDFSESLTREMFEELNMVLFNNTTSIVEETLHYSGLKKKDIHEIVLVGGSTKSPKVKKLLMDLFDGKEPKEGLNPDELAAYGATVHVGILTGEGQDHRCDCHKYSNSEVSSITFEEEPRTFLVPALGVSSYPLGGGSTERE